MKNLLSILLALIIMASLVTAAQAAEDAGGKSYIPALNLNSRDVEYIYTLDSENETYSGVRGAYGSHRWESLVTQLNNIGKAIGKVAPGESGQRLQGDLIVIMRDGARHSYKLEANNIMNVNGKRYQINGEISRRFQILRDTIANDRFVSIYPKWLAGIDCSNIVSSAEYANGNTKYANGDADSIEDVVIFVEWLDSFFEIAGVQRYKPGSVSFPKDKEYYEAVLTFTSGAILKVMVYGDTLCVESNQMKYGCQYRLKPKDEDVTTIMEAYNYDPIDYSRNWDL